MSAKNKTKGLVSQADMDAGGGGNENRLPATKRYRGVNYAVEDKNTLYEYGQGNVQGEPAAVLPIVDSFGDTPGATNPYGLVVTGSSFVGPNMKQVDMNTEELERIMGDKDQQELDESELTAELVGLEKTVKEDAPAPATSMDDLMEEAGMVDEFSGEDVPAITTDFNTRFQVQPIPQQQDLITIPVPAQRPSVRATLSSALGDFHGNYLACVVTDVCVVLITTLDENILTPKPSGDNLLEITTDDCTYEVYYYGQTFEYDNKRYQIYVRK